MNDIKIFFGKVVNVSDESKIYRCQIKINGYTDELESDKLPWYFPWYGKHNLPLIDDTVAVIIFDNNFVTGFYGNKIDLIDDNLEEGDYTNYLEIFKRNIDDNNIQLTYKKSEGIKFINSEGSYIQIELDLITLFNKGNTIKINEEQIIHDVGGNTLDIKKDTINIGNSGLEASLMGDKTVKELQDIIKHQSNTIIEIYAMFTAIAGACTTPFTLPIASAMSPLMPKQATLLAENSKVDSATKTLQSKMVFLNE